MRTEEILALGVVGRGSRIGKRIETLLARGRESSPRTSTARVAMSAAGLLALLAAASLSPRWIAFAQARPSFDAASVREVKFSDYGEPEFDFRPGSLTARPVSLHELAMWAYGVDASRLAGVGLLEGRYFDVTAKAAGPAAPDQLRLMLQTLLEQRFKLALHHERRILPVYSLTVAKGGPAMRGSKDPPRKGGRLGYTDHSFRYRMVNYISGLAQVLPSFLAGREVEDKTGLTGVYEIDLEVEMDAEQLKNVPQPGAPFNSFGYAPGVFDAVAKLGLKLESAKEPVDVLVIDHVEKPDAN